MHKYTQQHIILPHNDRSMLKLPDIKHYNHIWDSVISTDQTLDINFTKMLLVASNNKTHFIHPIDALTYNLGWLTNPIFQHLGTSA